jgi:hypothetical protein
VLPTIQPHIDPAQDHDRRRADHIRPLDPQAQRTGTHEAELTRFRRRTGGEGDEQRDQPVEVEVGMRVPIADEEERDREGGEEPEGFLHIKRHASR